MSATEDFVLEQARIVLTSNRLKATDDLWESDLDSLAAVELIERIESRSRDAMDIDDLVRYRTVEQISKRLDYGHSSRFEELIFNESGSKPAIFAIPGIGGYAKDYLHLARAMGPDQPVHVFPDVSLEARDLSIAAESMRIERAIIKLNFVGDISLLGYSGGGILALEVTRRLLAAGRNVQLFLLDASVKWKAEEIIGSVTEPAPWEGAQNLSQFFKQQYSRYQVQSTIFALTFRKYPKGLARYEFLMRRKNRIRAGFFPEPLLCEATYFSVIDNQDSTSWAKLIPGLRVIGVEGDHRTFMTPAYVGTLAAHIDAAISRN